MEEEDKYPKVKVLHPDPNCRWCKGKGWVFVRLDEFDVEKDPCDCVMD